MTSRGLRNNNPTNIDRHPGTNWLGAAEDQTGDSLFVVFTDAKYGIRACAKLILTYRAKYRLKTVRGLINRWAPPSENDTGAYVAAVARDCGVGPDEPINVDSMAVMLPLVKAIIVHENGSNPYPESVVVAGLHLAGVADAPSPAPEVVVVPPGPPKPLVKQASFVTKAAGVAIGAGGVAAQYAPTVKGWADQLKDYTDSPIIQHVAVAMMTLAGGLLLVSLVASMLKQHQAKAAANADTSALQPIREAS